MATLYEISGDLTALAALLEESGGDVSEIDAEAAIDTWLNELGAARDVKLDGYAALIREYEARAEARKLEAHRLTESAKSEANKAARLKERLKQFFALHGLKTLETRRFRLTLANNGGKLPVRVLAENQGAIPDEFCRFKREVDLESIRAALEAGESLEFAEFGERGQSLRIK